MARLGTPYCGAFREQNSCQCEACFMITILRARLFGLWCGHYRTWHLTCRRTHLFNESTLAPSAFAITASTSREWLSSLQTQLSPNNRVPQNHFSVSWLFYVYNSSHNYLHVLYGGAENHFSAICVCWLSDGKTRKTLKCFLCHRVSPNTA